MIIVICNSLQHGSDCTPQEIIFYSKYYNMKNIDKLKCISSRSPRMMKQLKILEGNRLGVERSDPSWIYSN